MTHALYDPVIKKPKAMKIMITVQRGSKPSFNIL